MKTSDFDFTLPPELIAQYPLPQRSASRLLCVQGATLRDTHFSSIVERLHSGDLLVFNNTRVIPARLLGEKSTGGKVEVLIERIIDSHRVLAHVRASKSPKPGSHLTLENVLDVSMLSRQGELFELQFNHDKPVLELLEQYGHMPLPPYITRVDDAVDQQRYQTVYARHPGAVAAPTAGLHFDNDLLNTIKQKGIETTFVTLHVGAGTFQPVRVANIHDHTMHAEYFDVTEDVVNKVKHTRQRGGRVIAVGTTAVRSLESAARDNELQVASGDTQIFIFPGYQFKVVDALITNFHLPQSTLLMLVCAFGGYDNIMAAYRHAVQQGYRFFSYGDAMFIEGRAI